MIVKIYNILSNTKAAILFAVLVFFTACQDTEQLPGDIFAQPIRPSHFPAPHYSFPNNPYSKDGFLLGKKLFYDPILSIDSTISCASCHLSQYAFSDAGHRYSTGINNRLGKRNSPAIFNTAWNRSFMWDGGINHIEIMPFAPIINPLEMGEELNHLIQKLKASPEYVSLFQKAFKKAPLDDQQLFWALAQFMGNIVSANSRYDQYLNGKIVFSNSEENGLQLFRTHCENCHSEPLFTTFDYYNNGIDSVFADSGRYRISQNYSDMGSFKTPSLRNIELTHPYMHDGRFTTLEEVLSHYSDAIYPSASLANDLAAYNGGMHLSATEKQDIITFLKTLTDEEFVQQEQYKE